MPWGKLNVNHGPDDLNHFSCFGAHLMTPFLDSGLWILITGFPIKNVGNDSVLSGMPTPDGCNRGTVVDCGLPIEPSPLTPRFRGGRDRSLQGLRSADNIHQFFRNRGLPRFIVKQGDFLNEFSGISRCPIHRGHPSGLFGGRGF